MRPTTKPVLVTSMRGDNTERRGRTEEGSSETEVVVEDVRPGRGVGAQAQPEGEGQGLPRRAGSPRPVELLTGSRSRHSGLSWQRAKRTAQSGPGSFHKAAPRAAPS